MEEPGAEIGRKQETYNKRDCKCFMQTAIYIGGLFIGEKTLANSKSQQMWFNFVGERTLEHLKNKQRLTDGLSD